MSEYVKELQMHIRDREYKIESLRKENEELRREIGKPYDKVDRLFEANRKLIKENAILREALSDVINYLHWSGDSLKGDDLIGDQNLTKIYNEKIEIIEKSLEKVKSEKARVEE